MPSSVARRAVFLDRDGVISRSETRQGKPYAPLSAADFELLPGVVEAVGQLRGAGFLLIVVTNQPDIASGKLRHEDMEEMHRQLRTWLPVDDIKVCVHRDEDDCRCRKPKPGMLWDSACDWNIDLNQSWMVGDRWRDILAGRRAGCRTILIDYGYDEPLRDRPDFVSDSLLEATTIILQQDRQSNSKRKAVQ